MSGSGYNAKLRHTEGKEGQDGEEKNKKKKSKIPGLGKDGGQVKLRLLLRARPSISLTTSRIPNIDSPSPNGIF